MPNLQPSPDSPLRPAEVIALISSMLLVGTSFGAVAPLVSALLEQRGFSEYFTGGVSAMLAVAVALLSTRVGRLVERHGTQRINFLGLVGQALGFAGLGMALAFYEPALFIVRFALGAAATMTFVAAEVSLLRGVAAHVRGRVMAAYGASLASGFTAGVFVSDWAYDWVGLWCFGLVAVAALFIAPLAWWGLRGEIGQPAPKLESHFEQPSAGGIDWQSLWLGLFGAIVFGALDMAIAGTYPVEGQRLGLSRSETMQIVGFTAFGMVFTQPICGWLADKFGVRRTMAGIGVFGMACCLAAGIMSQKVLAGEKIWATLAFVGIGVGVGGVYPVSLKILGDRTPPGKLPVTNARFSMLYGYASLFGPILAAFAIDVMETLGYLGWAVPGLSGVTMAMVLILVIWDRRHEKAASFSNR
ncbi:MAG: putative MFS-type transporter YcaD [bacterium]|nr:putative MFS-type transporter YcaD [bacterium]